MKIPSSNGFTLIEIVVVVAIVGLLASFAVPVYVQYVARAQVADGVSLTHRVRAAVEEFVVDKGIFPASIADLERYNVEFSSNYVASISLAPAAGTVVSGEVVTEFKNINVSQLIAGRRISYFRSPEGDWSCQREGVGGTTLDQALLPKQCD